MKTIKRKDALVYEANPNLEPALKVKPKEVFKVEAEDNFEQVLIKKGSGSFTADDLKAAQYTPLKANPVGGPIYIEGAENGDLLAITIEDVVPLQYGWTGEMLGSLQDKVGWEECHGYWAYVTEQKPGPSGTTSDGTVHIDIDGQKFVWNAAPFIGTIFTQPQKGRGMPNTLLVNGPGGGNVDIRDVCKGSTVYLNSFNEGGLLYLGDCHAAQADSEFTGMAVECPADVTLSVDVIKNKRIPGVMRIEKADSIIQVDTAGNSGTPTAALENAFIDLMKWLVEEYGFSKRSAYINMTANPDVRIHVYQFIPGGGFFSCGVEIPKKYLNQFK